jgi:CubicO group peptidase (beta-lactamase class C family)
MPLAFRPGEKAEYDNTGYVALARVVEHVSGMSLDRFLRTRIFDVVGMKKEHPYQYLAIQKTMHSATAGGRRIAYLSSPMGDSRAPDLISSSTHPWGIFNRWMGRPT